MNAIVPVGDMSVFEGMFEVVETNGLESLLEGYKEERQRIESLATLLSDTSRTSVLPYFIKGNVREDRYVPDLTGLFQVEGAIAALNAAYWDKALKLTDIYEHMPQNRRSDWYDQIREFKTPDFTLERVIPTFQELLMARGRFMAERVEGIFRALSGEHVTNRPEGFSKVMIINRAFDESGWPSYDRAGYLNDLRAVISKLIGREHTHWFSASNELMKVCRRRTGEWHEADNGTLKIKTFKKGTMHLEVHPDIAAQLNEILAFLYPAAIPHMYKRRKTEKGFVSFTLSQQPISTSVLSKLSNMKISASGRKLEVGAIGDKHFRQSVHSVLETIGGVIEGGYCFFDYDASDVLDDIILNGYLPEQKSHQYYPTEDSLAAKAVMMAGIEERHTCLEPSAGQGGIAQFLPKESTTCIEISDVHCNILRAKGFETVQADFIPWAKTAKTFDRIVMNPPYSQGRAQLHLETAASLLKPGGRLVAILPASFAGKSVLNDCSIVWSDVYENQFSDTGISVVILTAERL